MNCENSTGAHLDDTVAENGSILPVVRHVDHGQMEGRLQPRKLRPERGPELDVQARQRLVQQKHLRLSDDCPGKGKTLLLSARKLVWEPGPELFDPNQRQRALYSPASLCA